MRVDFVGWRVNVVRQIVDIERDNFMKHVNVICGQNEGYLNVKQCDACSNRCVLEHSVLTHALYQYDIERSQCSLKYFIFDTFTLT
jgi:hypothetical protein